ncbi:MAG TPA: TIM barrel protein [Caulobacteraceae bacterium]|nr:TIM barrel protein [Caulobacteraceae bacterium]
MATLLDAQNRQDLIISAYTIDGLDGVATLEERAAAAAKAGFRKIGMTREQYLGERHAGRSDADLRAILGHHGIENVEIEYMFGWAGTGGGSGLPGQPQVDWRDRERDLYALADAVGARHMNCGEVGFGSLLPMDALAERFAGIADRAKEHGMLALLQFMPYAGIADIETAADIVRRADHPNAGILLDTWHFFRGNPDFEAVRKTPPEKIMLIQLCDGKSPYGDLRHDSVHARKLPGEGEFDLKGLMALLDEAGVNCPISIEVLSDELAALSPEAAAKQVFDGTRAFLDSIIP